MKDRISPAVQNFNESVQKLYQARLTLSTIRGGGSMSPTRKKEIIADANKIISEITDENVQLAVEAKLDDAHNTNQGSTYSNKWCLVKIPN